MTSGKAPQDIDERDRLAVVRALGDTPETVIGVHLLRRGLCRALINGEPDRPDAAMLQVIADPSEPAGFGNDPAALWHLLRALHGWRCVNVPRAVGPQLAARIEAETGRACRLYEDVYHVLMAPVAARPHPAVRRLTPADRPLLDTAESDLGTPGWNWGGTEVMLRESVAAGAVVDGRLVAIAFAAAMSTRHADVGVATLSPWQRQGLATAAAALVCAGIQATGRTPVWSTGEDNQASLRVAGKLGFVEVLRRVYVIPQ